MSGDCYHEHDSEVRVLIDSDRDLSTDEFAGDIAVTTPSQREAGAVDGIDCLVCDAKTLTDSQQRPLIAADDVSIVALLDNADRAAAALEDGADDIFVCGSTVSAQLLEHRIRSVVERTAIASITDMKAHLQQPQERSCHRQRLEVLYRVLRHDIRTTSNLLLGYAERLDQTDADDVAADITATARHMARLSDNIRQLADVATEQHTSYSRIDVSQLLRRRVDSFQKRYPSASIHTTIDGPASVQTNVKLDIAIDHVLENAIVHTGSAPVVDVELWTIPDEETVVIQIADNGPGIPEAERAVIDCREETPLEHSSGLGLWIASWIVDATAGSLSLCAEDGTTVTITLPLAAPDLVSSNTRKTDS